MSQADFTPATLPTLIRLKHLLEITKLGRSTVYDKLSMKSPRYDAAFPKPIKLGASAVAWRLSDVEAWVNSRV